MPILQNIQIAEQEAEKLRQNAHAEVEELRERTKLEAEEEARKVIENANKEIKLNNQKTLDLIDYLERENIESISKEKAALEEIAKKNQEVGVNYILKQVIGI